MSTNLRAPGAQSHEVDGSGRSIAIVCSRFNDAIVTSLEQGARRALVERGVDDGAIDTVWVPGALEIRRWPLASRQRGDTTPWSRWGRSSRATPTTSRWVCDASAAG